MAGTTKHNYGSYPYWRWVLLAVVLIPLFALGILEWRWRSCVWDRPYSEEFQ